MSSIKNQLETLVALQQAEIEIRRIEQDLSGIDGRIETLSEEIKAFEGRVAEFQAALERLKQQYRSDENDIKIIDSQIAPFIIRKCFTLIRLNLMDITFISF